MKDFESQPFCRECAGPKNYKGGFDHYENCSLAREGGEIEEEFIAGEIKENPELPESEFGSYQNIEKGKKEKTPVVVETEQEKRIKKFVWDMLDKDVELKDQIVFSRGGKNEIVSNFFKRKIESKVNEAVKGGKLMPEDTYNHCQKIWDELERIGDDVFIQAKGKIFLKAKE